MVRRRRWLAAAAGGLALPVLLAAGFWWVWLSPFGYEFTEASLLLDEGPHKVFAYGTLTRPWVRRLVTGQSQQHRPASIEGYRREGLDLVPAPGVRTPGVVFEVSGDELRRLDRYERLGIRYRRELRPLSDGATAWVYFREQPQESATVDQ